MISLEERISLESKQKVEAMHRARTASVHMVRRMAVIVALGEKKNEMKEINQPLGCVEEVCVSSASACTLNACQNKMVYITDLALERSLGPITTCKLEMKSSFTRYTFRQKRVSSKLSECFERTPVY